MESRFRRAHLPSASGVRDFFRPRYLALGISLFIAMYVGLKFILVVFNAADFSERWSFELTPLAALALPDLQLAFLSAVAGLSNAFLHYSVERKHRVVGLLVTASMVAGLLLALRGATVDLDPVNLGRVEALVLLLAIVPLDHIDLLRSAREAPEDFIESELHSIAEAGRGRAVTPAAVRRALQELEALVKSLPEKGPAPIPDDASVGTADDEYLRELMTSVLREADEREKPSKPALPAVPRAKTRPIPREKPLPEAVGEMEAVPSIRRVRLGRAAVWLEEARALMERGKLEKALRRLDRVAAKDARYPGLWDLAAEAYERLGEPDVAAECRRRARESAP